MVVTELRPTGLISSSKIHNLLYEIFVPDVNELSQVDIKIWSISMDYSHSDNQIKNV